MITLKFAVVLLFLHRGLFALGNCSQFPGAETQTVEEELYYQGFILFCGFFLFFFFLIGDGIYTAAESFSSEWMKEGMDRKKKVAFTAQF